MNRTYRIAFFTLAIGAIFLSTFEHQAIAANQLTNPGFETGDFAGWTVGGNSLQTGVATDGTPIPNADHPFPPNFVNVHSGNYAGHALVKNGMDPAERITLRQTVVVAENTDFNVGFWLGNDSMSGFGMDINSTHTQIFIDGVGLLPNEIAKDINPGNSPASFYLLSSNFNTGDRNSIEVTFAINGSGTSHVGVSFDDFFLNAVPEPTTLTLMACGLIAFGRCRRRRA